MSTLVSLSDFDGVAFRFLSQNTDVVDIDPYILEAQEIDIAPSIGQALYFDLTEGPDKFPDDGKYDDLVNGSVFENCDKDDVKQYGLKRAIMYYALARYLIDNPTNHTPTGFQVKEQDFGSQPSLKHIDTRKDNMRSAGIATLNTIHEFLIENRDTYPLYKCRRTDRKGGAIISVVDRRRTNDENKINFTNRFFT